eukprot:1194566-Pyramimonas_sp.AAC.1
MRARLVPFRVGSVATSIESGEWGSSLPAVSSYILSQRPWWRPRRPQRCQGNGSCRARSLCRWSGSCS